MSRCTTPSAKLALDAVAAGQRLRHALESVGHARLTCDRLRERASRQLIRLVPALVGRVEQARGEKRRDPFCLTLIPFTANVHRRPPDARTGGSIRGPRSAANIPAPCLL